MATTTERPVRRLDLDLRLPSDPSAPAVARETIRELDGAVPDRLVEQLSLIASELVTNALRHAVTPDPCPTLEVALDPSYVRLAVSDRGTMFGPPVGIGDGIDGGWGLRLVDSLADRWWVEHKGGTRVICEFRR
jgi:anti-sigma regulatory factor (Ser/Thr protein kinase)